MTKRLQSTIAGSRLALPLTTLYTIVIWLLAGTADYGWWLQLGCFAVSCYLMLQLNNAHVLIRVYSRMVSCAYMLLMCMACFLFPSLQGAVMQACMVGCLLLLFATYLNHEAAALTFYAFGLLGCASIFFIHVLWLTPVLWILMATNLMSLSWRTWVASILGVLMPYWIWGACQWFIGDIGPLTEHFSISGESLTTLQTSLFNLHTLRLEEMLCYALTAGLSVTGIIHYINQHSGDKIRVRMLFYSLIWLSIAVALYIVVFPANFQMSYRLLVVVTAPLIAHFIALTNTKVTNYAFMAIIVFILLVTAFNLSQWTF